MSSPALVACTVLAAFAFAAAPASAVTTPDQKCRAGKLKASGNCTIGQVRSCFADTIAATGLADPETPRSVGVLCLGQVGASGVNDSFGLPGPARVRTDLDVTYAAP
jgi:hypothetical protein